MSAVKLMRTVLSPGGADATDPSYAALQVYDNVLRSTDADLYRVRCCLPDVCHSGLRN
jgi:hypothetical protein